MSSIDALVNRQLLRWERRAKETEEEEAAVPPPPQVVTVSRQAGSRGAFFAQRLAEELGFQRLHREAIEAISKTSGYRSRIVEALDERYRNDVEVLAESLVSGQTVDHRDYYRHLFEVVLSMARLGGVVLVGRAGNFILGPLRGFHIRVIAPRQQRIANLMRYKEYSEKQAIEEMEFADGERMEMMAKLFKADIEDPSHYDLVINMASLDLEAMIPPTVAAIKTKFARLADAG